MRPSLRSLWPVVAVPRASASLILGGASMFALLALALAIASAPAPAFAAPAYYLYPDIHGGSIVFAAESDLWLVSDAGGEARRLTTHPGAEFFPQFSPDGKSIAFSGQYDGDVDVYVIPASGGEPRRLTWHPGPDEVVGWTPDGSKILFRSARWEPNHNEDIFAVPVEGGDAELLPIGYAGRIDIDPQTGLYAFVRNSTEFATWKRYRGGTAPDIWVGDPSKADFRKVTDFEGTDSYPMWNGGLLYFLSDRGGTMNLWSMKPDGAGARRLTDFQEWDARQASIGPDGRIVFTLAADAWIYDPASGEARKVDIDLPSDRVLTRVRYPDAAPYVTCFDISPDGGRLALTARGEIFSVPVEDGVTLPITRGSGARENWASFDPKGERIVYVTDEPREEEIRVIDAWGRGKPVVVKPAGESGGWNAAPLFSPDGRWIAYSDMTQTLFVVAADGGSPPHRVDQAEADEIHDYAWSPDGRWLAYSKRAFTGYSTLCIYDTKSGEVHPMSDGTTDDHGPCWDPEGRYLYFVSERATNPILGNQDWDNVEAKRGLLYLALLRKDVENPFAAREGMPPHGDGASRNDDGKAKNGRESGNESDGENGEKGEKAPPEPVAIDFDGLAERVVPLDIERGGYSQISATAKRVFYLSAPLRGFAEMEGLFEEPGPQSDLMVFDLDEMEAEPFVEGVADYRLAADAEKIALMKDKGDFYVVDANGEEPDLEEGKVSIADVVIDLDPREEWAQIFYEGWRNQRDFYWDAEMAGLDWRKIGEQYATLLPRLSSRADLSDLMGELIGELNTSHTYLWGGDPGVQPRSVSVGLLGADVHREGSAYKVTRIYRGAPADQVVSPLAAPGVNLAEGMYILQVNHQPFADTRAFESYFENLAGRPAALTVNEKPAAQGAREVVVVPVADEGDLRYSDWVRRNREYVSEKTGGRIGYVHIPDMWQHGLIEFNTWFYPQLDKEGMIVDARWNGGGAVSQQIVERLRRRLVSFNRGRWSGVATYPDRVLNGPFVVLTNQFAGSDGDIFPAVVQMEKLAPVIGVRTWGGVVGISGLRPLVDNGLETQPQSAWWDAVSYTHLRAHETA
ncbi:MAG: PDZ domain-containing protein, partial [Candidatus Eisenbacteria bacterium]|nr:PDZ domain-containing protein [Candidatus Eisenbacteria bacterium]